MEPNSYNNWAGVLAEGLIEEINALSKNYDQAISERRLNDARSIHVHKECILVELRAITAHRAAIREKAEKRDSHFGLTHLQVPLEKWGG